ncbi:MAG TPA: hypothetical protein VH575_00270 [Gemmataceae bacterium]|jgi:hypothetical protein
MLNETLVQHDSDIPYALAAVDEETPPVRVNEHSLLGLVELLLKAPAQLDAWTRDPARQGELIPRLLALALASFGLFAAVLVLLLLYSKAAAVPSILEHWNGSAGPAIALGLAYPAGMVAATGVCLPTFYFFGLLAGVRISVLQVTTHVLRGKAATAVFLLGLTPIYLAVTLGLLIFRRDDVLALSSALLVGLALPFLAGVWGVRAIYVGFLGLADTLPPERRCRRTCFLRRLTVAWAAVYSAVTPVMIWSLYQNLAARWGG